jgi:acyl-ACP thioesterase
MNNTTFEQTIHLRTSDFDVNGRLTSSAILDLFQTAAGRHAEILGVGYNDMLSKNLFWVVLRIKYEVLKYPPLYGDVKIITWPHEAGRIDFDRDYLIKDENGVTLVKGTSKWVTIYADTRKMAITDISYNINDFCRDRTFDDKFLKSEDFDTSNLIPYTTQSAYTDLDVNGHVNNIKYVNYVINALNLNEEISYFQIDYHKEVLNNSLINIYTQREDKTIKCKGCNSNNETNFICTIVLK